MRTETITNQYFTVDELKEEAIKEAKLLWKKLRDKIVFYKVSEYNYSDGGECFYGRIFGSSVHEEAILFKKENKLKLYKKVNDSEEYLLVSEYNKEGMTALEIVTSEYEDLGDLINLQIRTNWKFTNEQLAEMNLV